MPRFPPLLSSAHPILVVNDGRLQMLGQWSEQRTRPWTISKINQELNNYKHNITGFMTPLVISQHQALHSHKSSLYLMFVFLSNIAVKRQFSCCPYTLTFFPAILDIRSVKLEVRVKRSNKFNNRDVFDLALKVYFKSSHRFHEANNMQAPQYF